MKKFTVNVTETSHGFVEVEANSKEEAMELAAIQYEDGNIYWNNSEYAVGCEDTPPDIRGITLLSVEEAESLLTEKERRYSNSWWLRTPGYYRDGACYVGSNGYVYCYGDGVDGDDVGVRPALIINLESSDLKVGDTFKFGDKEFKILSPTIAWMHKDDIGRCAFRKDWEADDANNYEASDVKKFVDEWFKAAKAF